MNVVRYFRLALALAGLLFVIGGATDSQLSEITYPEYDVGVLASNVFTGETVEIVHTKIIERVP